MKKLFINVPMKDRTEEQIRESIRKMHRIAEAVWGEELEVIDSYIADAIPSVNSEAVWCLGESIKRMAEADYFIGVEDYFYRYIGCSVENMVADSYDIPRFRVPIAYIAPDVKPNDSCVKEARTEA